MRFAPSGSNCGAATAARFLHLFKFGLVVFRRVTFGDGRQSRRLPAAFLYRPGRTQRPDARRQAMRRTNAKADARRQTLLRPNTKADARRQATRRTLTPFRSVPPPTGTPRSCPRSVRSRSAPDGPAPPRTSTHRAARRRTVPFCAIRVQTSAPRAHLHLHPSPHPKKSGARRGFCTRFAPLHHDCGLSNRREVSSFIKFGLVVFRRATFGDGRQSRRLPAAFFVRNGVWNGAERFHTRQIP